MVFVIFANREEDREPWSSLQLWPGLDLTWKETHSCLRHIR